MIREKLERLIRKAAEDLWGETGLEGIPLSVERTDKMGFGDYSTNVAFALAKKLQKTPMEIAEKLGEAIVNSPEMEQVKWAGGFINFYLSKQYLNDSLAEIYLQKYIAIPQAQLKQKINLEFVSANPTGPLTLGNGRASSYGSTLASIFRAVGHEVTKEYYVNDIGRQVEKLGESVGRKFLQLSGREVDFPEDLYQGDYIMELAQKFKDQDIYPGGLDNQELLFQTARDFALTENLNSIQDALKRFGVEFDEWFSEKSLHDRGELKEVMDWLTAHDLVYENEGALWFRGMEFGLDADVVVRKSNGLTTYLMSDFAYAKNKLARGFDKNIYIFGADHHGDVIRLKAGLRALGLMAAPTSTSRGSDQSVGREKFEFILLQLVALKQKGEAVRMSKRAGRFVTLDELLLEVPADVVKFFFLMKSLDTHIEFDLDLAKEQSSKNPVYYIQYAYARINSIFNKAKEQGIEMNADLDSKKLAGLESETELALVRKILRLPEIVMDTAGDYQVHRVAHYAMELAAEFHKFYDSMPILSAEPAVRDARSALAAATQIALKQSLTLMGLNSPEKM